MRQHRIVMTGTVLYRSLNGIVNLTTRPFAQISVFKYQLTGL